MSRLVDRAFEIVAATLPRAPRDGLAHPFGIAAHDPHGWRLSRDVWDQLRDHVGSSASEPEAGDTLLGEPVTVDESLPPNSMLLEPMDPSREG